jgi:hypothetical protein
VHFVLLSRRHIPLAVKCVFMLETSSLPEPGDGHFRDGTKVSCVCQSTPFQRCFGDVLEGNAVVLAVVCESRVSCSPSCKRRSQLKFGTKVTGTSFSGAGKIQAKKAPGFRCSGGASPFCFAFNAGGKRRSRVDHVGQR